MLRHHKNGEHYIPKLDVAGSNPVSRSYLNQAET